MNMIGIMALVTLAALIALRMYGQQVVGTIGRSLEVVANGKNQFRKIGGITIDWATVAAITGSDVIWRDNVLVQVGQKGLRYGQVVCLITSTANGGLVGYYGPYDPAATDGRQTLTRGACFILNTTALQLEPRDQYPEAIFGGSVFWDRIIQSGVGAASLAAGPTEANTLTAFPMLHPHRAG